MQSMHKKQRDKIAEELNKYLGPELVSYRRGSGFTDVSYVEGWTIVNIANKIFGFDGWSHTIIKTDIDYCEVENKKVSCGIFCISRVTLTCGVSKEDTGYGIAENMKSKGMALEKARKEAVTDSLKRCLRHFGNALGNCLYDKHFREYIKKIESEKEHKGFFNAKDLLRKSDTTKHETTTTTSVDIDMLNSLDIINGNFNN